MNITYSSSALSAINQSDSPFKIGQKVDYQLNRLDCIEGVIDAVDIATRKITIVGNDGGVYTDDLDKFELLTPTN